MLAFAIVGTIAGSQNGARAQSGGPYVVRRGTVDGGGATTAAGGIYIAGATIGQLDAGSASGASFALGGGFWGGGALVAAPTPTQTSTPTRTATTVPSQTSTATVPSTPARTPTASVQVPVATGTPTTTAVVSRTPSATTTASPPTGSLTPTPTATPTPPTIACAGDCDESGSVTIDELVLGVNIALGHAALSDCPALNTNGDARVNVDELVRAVGAALQDCKGDQP